MEAYEKWDIQELPLSAPFFRRQVESFLQANGLRMEALDAYFTLQAADGSILAGAGLQKDILKCVAVGADVRSEGLLVPLISHVVSVAATRGIHNLKVFTKPEYQPVFESLGFKLLASAPDAILLENGRGLERYCHYLRSLHRPGRNGVIVMNANPFTLGHRYLIRKASEQVDNLYIIPVKEDLSLFPYTERLAMIQSGLSALHTDRSLCHSEGPFCHSERSEESGPAAIATPTHTGARVIVVEGSDYQISAATFPTYFLKDLSTAAETQMRLDLDLFKRWIAQALGNPVRFVGSEPGDALTARYNVLMQEALPTVEIPRIAVSATAVRQYLAEGNFHEAAALCPATTHPYLLAVLAERALRLELDTPGKPGLVGPDSNGAHKDMDYALMRKGIAAIRPFFPQMALAASAEELRQLGISAEKAMLSATSGVNTHRGAIFCLGITLNAWAQCAGNEKDMQLSIGKIAGGIYAINQNINDLPPRSAVQNALGGYKELFEDWLPFYRKQKTAEGPVGLSGASAFISATESPTPSAEQMTLLRIMSTLDDTCVIKRVGKERAQEVKKMADQVGHDNGPSITGELKEMCTRFAQEGISPGGAADMLALTIFIDSII